MAYLGNRPATGENNAFRILDDISSHVVTFNASSSSVVSLANDTITIPANEHRFITGQRVSYAKGSGGTIITGLAEGVYYIIDDGPTTFKLATTLSNANNSVAVNFTGLGAGTAHTITLAFDDVNTKFKPTYLDGTQQPLITRAAQLVISIDGVIQQPHDSASPTSGFGIDTSTGDLIFSEAPNVNDDFWGHVHASNTVTFDISDNKVDNFTGDASTTEFTLSKTPPNNENILVTIDGVVQYPSDNTTTRAYTLSENLIQFVSAPGLNTVIQVRHIGFAGNSSGSGGVTGFYGRTGNVVLKNTDNIVANDATFSGNVSIAQTLTYMDVSYIDAVGIITAQSDVNFNGSGVGISSAYWDSSANEFKFKDNVKAAFGDAGELNIWAAGGASYIRESGGSGQLVIQGSNLILESTGGTDYLYGIDGGTTALCFGGNSKIQTTGYGVTVFGTTETQKLHVTGISTFAGTGTFTGDVSIADKIIHTGDTNTAIRFPAADTISFETGGGERLRIDSSGRVGIGTDNPNNPLTVHGSGNHIFLKDTATNNVLQIRHQGGTAQFNTYGTGGARRDIVFSQYTTEVLRINSSGQVLVGDGSAITPVKHFDVRGTGYQGILVGSTNNQGAQVVIDGIGGGDAAGGNYSALEVPTSGHLTIRNLDADKDIILGTGAQNGSNDTVIITDTQMVGIGVDPGAIIHAYHATSNTIAQFESGDAGAAAIWKDNSTYSAIEQNATDFIIHADPGASHAGSALSFKIDGNERLRISNAGFVTINSSSYEALKITTTENGNNGPEVQLFHNSASPAAADCIGQLRFSGKDSAGNTDLMSRIETIIDDPTSGQETAHINFGTRGYSAFNTILRLKARGTASAPSYTTDDINGIILDTYNGGGGSGYPRYFSFIAKSAGNTDSNLSFWTEAVGGSPTEKLRIHSHGQLELKVPDANPALKITPSGTNAPAAIDFNTPGNGAAVFKVQGTQRLSLDKDGNITNTGIATSYVTTTFSANFAKLDLRGTNIGNSNHYLLSYGEGHANDHEFHMVNTVGHLVFRTGSSGQTQRVRINSNGEMSIGGQHASYAYDPNSYGNPSLLIAGDDNADILTLMNDDPTPNNGDYASLGFRVAGQSTGSYAKAAIIAERNGGYNALDFLFCLGTDADATRTTTSHEKLRLKSTGKLELGQGTGAGELQLYGSSYSVLRMMSSQSNGEHYTLNSAIPGVSNTGFCIRNESDNRNDFYIWGDGQAKFENNIEVVGEVKAKSAWFTDNGTTSPIVDIRADDGSPWQLQIANDSYSTGHHGLNLHLSSSGVAYMRNLSDGAYKDIRIEVTDGSTTKTPLKVQSTGIVVDGTSGIYANRMTITDDGATGPLLSIRADDGGPWALAICNDTYSTGNHGLFFYTNSSGSQYVTSMGNGSYKSTVYNQSDGSTNRDMLILQDNGDVRLYHAGAGPKAYTQSHGFRVDGQLYAYSNNDWQMRCWGSDSWAGIQFKDVNNSDQIWYNGGNSTFTIGGGGSSQVNRKLHVHGGVSIGSGYQTTSHDVGANGLMVEGRITAGGSYVWGKGTFGKEWSKARFGMRVNWASGQNWAGGNGTAIASMSSSGGETGTGGSFSHSGASENNLGYVDHAGAIPCSAVWRCQNNDASSNFDGAWSKAVTDLPGDDWGYMSTLMVRRVGSSTSGQFYHGCDWTHTLNQNGSSNGNPYFTSFNIATLPQDVWCLSIGIITGNGAGDNGSSSGSGTNMSGIWRMDTGQKIVYSQWYRMKDGSTTQTHRTYLYYSTNSSDQLQYRQPGFYCMDGSEPSISELSHGRLCWADSNGIVPVEDA